MSEPRDAFSLSTLIGRTARAGVASFLSDKLEDIVHFLVLAFVLNSLLQTIRHFTQFALNLFACAEFCIHFSSFGSRLSVGTGPTSFSNFLIAASLLSKRGLASSGIRLLISWEVSLLVRFVGV